MNLSDFQNLIVSLPVDLQAFRSKRKSWRRFNDNPAIAPLINRIFDEQEEVTINRNDLRAFAGVDDLALFVMATIVWGYPRGMRGNHVGNISNRMADLIGHLRNARNGIHNWSEHYRAIDISGLGLSTYTKFLHFLGVRVEGLPSLILDDRIIKVAKREVFDDLSQLRGLRSHNASQQYVAYLERMHAVAENMNVHSAQIELFLFMFGGNLKPVIAQ